MLSRISRVLCVYGPPGSGKTTVAERMAADLKAAYVSSGDIARMADPTALARGELADRGLIKEALTEAIWKPYEAGQLVVVDGAPRPRSDIDLMPRLSTGFILLDCWPEVAIQRQLDRGRNGDEAELVKKRTEEQRAVMELDDPKGWAYALADVKVQTGSRTRMQVYSEVMSTVAAALLAGRHAG